MNDQKVPTGDEKNTETEEEEMEHESADSEKSSDGEEIESGSEDHDEGSDEESSDLDEEDCERRRNECILDMVELERQFFELKDQLYRERLNEVEAKLEEVTAGRAHEYLNPLAQLQENMSIRTQVAGILRELRIQAISNKFDCEQLAAYQHMESEKKLLYDGVKEDLEERVRRLEEDRHNIDISSDLWHETEKQKRTKKSRFDPFNTDRRKKPVTVSGPYIIYMLKDVEIIEDWTAIKKAIKQQNQKKKSDYF